MSQVREAPGVVGVEVCKYHVPDVSGRDSESGELSADFLVGMNGKTCRAAKKGCQPGKYPF
jgi:hypothetical protein